MNDAAIEGVHPVVANLIGEARDLLHGFDAQLGPDDRIYPTERGIDDAIEIAWLPPWRLRRCPGARLDERGHTWLPVPEE